MAGLGLLGLGLVGWAGRARVPGECVAAGALGLLVLSLRLHAPVPELDRNPVELTLLAAPRVFGERCELLAYLHAERPGRARLWAGSGACRLLPAQKLLARVKLLPQRGRRNPGQGDARRRSRRRGIRAVGRISEGEWVAIAEAPRIPSAAVQALRLRLGDALDPPERPTRAGALLRALALGDRSRLSPEVRGSFARSGTAHLLAVSGLHVGWLFAIAHALLYSTARCAAPLAWLRRARAVSLAASALVALGYALLSGLGVPALRACVMALAGVVALIAGRPGVAWNALLLAALATLAVDPACLFEPSGWLSFSAVAGLLLWRPPPRWATGLVHCALAAGCATAPLIALLGLPLPLAGLAANLLAVPFFGAVLLPLALFAAAFETALPELGLGALARVSAELGLRLVESVESPDLLRRAGFPLLFTVALTATAFCLRRLALGGPRRLLAVSALSAAVAAASLALPVRNLRVDPFELVFLDVGQGDATLARAGRRAWLIDSGDRRSGYDAGRSVVAPALRSLGVRKLDALLITHADRDHSGGARAVLEALPVGELWLTRWLAADSAGRRLLRAASRLGVPARIVSAGDSLGSRELGLEVLWPPASRLPRSSNAGSVVLRAHAPAGCAMLPADAPADVERILARDLGACRLLKLGHHGSQSSSAGELLDALGADVAIASAGRRPRSPLPHSSVLQRLGRRSITLWETRRFGALSVQMRPGPGGMVVSPSLWGRPDSASGAAPERPFRSQGSMLPDGAARGRGR